jgi:hypothetical protein
VGISVAMVLFVYDVSTAKGMEVVALAPLEYTAREVPLEDLCFLGQVKFRGQLDSNIEYMSFIM